MENHFGRAKVRRAIRLGAILGAGAGTWLGFGAALTVLYQPREDSLWAAWASLAAGATILGCAVWNAPWFGAIEWAFEKVWPSRD